VTIQASPDRVWEAIGNFQDMSWHPAVVRTEGANGNAPEATRKLTLQGGGTIDEVLAKHEPAQKSYSYRITAVDVKVLPVTNYSSTLAVVPAAGGSTTVEWRGAFYRGYPNNDPPPELNDEAAMKTVSAVYRAGLVSRLLRAALLAALALAAALPIGPAADEAFVTDQPGNAVAVVDLDRMAVVARLPSRARPREWRWRQTARRPSSRAPTGRS
jgi:hypothetical protein